MRFVEQYNPIQSDSRFNSVDSSIEIIVEHI